MEHQTVWQSFKEACGLIVILFVGTFVLVGGFFYVCAVYVMFPWYGQILIHVFTVMLICGILSSMDG